jgi:hypothetical protein
MVKGNSKGKRGERKICETLSERFKSYGKFNRIPTSGAFGSTHQLSESAKKAYCGDVLAPDPSFIFSLEIKTGYNIDILNLFSDKSTTDHKTVVDFLFQACSDANRIEGRIPMLIYQKDRREVICFIPEENHNKKFELKEIINNKLKKYMRIYFEIKDFEKWNYWYVIPLVDLLNVAEDSFFFEDKRNE